MYAKVAVLFHFFIAIPLFSQAVLINEVMAVNQSTIADEDGDFPDWLELYNAGETPVDIGGFALSDDDDPAKWILPPLNLAPYKHLLIFASDKDRSELLYWDTVIRQGDVWRYRNGSSEPPSNWAEIGYNDSNWPIGASGFGYGDDDDATIVPGAVSIYVRKHFFIDDIDALRQAVLHIDYDDAFVAYVNGHEIARQNLGSHGEFIAHDRLADAGHEALMIQGLPPEQFDIHDLSLFRQGDNVLAVQVHNVSQSSSDMSLIPFLSLGTTSRPEGSGRVPDILNLPSTFLHTNFKITSAGETIQLFDADGVFIDSVRSPVLSDDISYARVPDGASTWQLSAVPTPGAANVDSLYTPPADAPDFSHAGGLYDAPFSLRLSASPGSTIYYTLDGSEPDQSATRYDGAISLNTTTCVRARCYEPPLQSSRIITHTFIFNEETEFAVIALSSDPHNLFDDEYGIFAYGPNANSDYPYMGANFWQDWERPVHVEFYEPTGEAGFVLDAGMKVFGGWSRGREQKSVAIFQRGQYDSRQIDYQIFPQKPIYHFESFILRNGGNDWTHTMFRDAFMQSLCDGAMDLETMAYRPAHVYLNGAYWGILIIREKINEHFLAANRGLDPDRVDILDSAGQSSANVMEGSNDDYRNLWQFFENHDLSIDENYAAVADRIDINNFIDYQIAHIYFGNTDWPGNNIKYYRPQTLGGTWRWLIYDTDFGFHLYDTSYSHNTLEFATEPYGPGWPNPPWSTFLLRSLLENDHFTRQFVNRFADHMNTTFDVHRVLDRLDDFDALFGPEIHRQRRRWPGSVSNYNSSLHRMKTFAERREVYMRSYIRAMFDIDHEIAITLNAAPANSGTVRVNSKEIHTFPWSGDYFSDIPVEMTAIPNPGYRFERWQGVNDSAERIVYDAHDDLSVTAVFQYVEDAAVDLVINEINYNSGDNFPAKDWLELYNPGDVSLSLRGWHIKDAVDEHLWKLPSHAVIPAHGYAILCTDSTFFHKVYSGVSHVYGDMPFNLSNAGDSLYLYHADGHLVDSVFYDDDAPWPLEADGDGYTLELRDPHADNMQPLAWAASHTVGGSPGQSNSRRTVVARVTDLPCRFSLGQNYPNPFNGVTTIEFTLSQPGFVTLCIFDVTGRQVETVVAQHYAAGVFRTTWSAHVASGVYFYRLTVVTETTPFSATRKLLLIQ